MAYQQPRDSYGLTQSYHAQYDNPRPRDDRTDERRHNDYLNPNDHRSDNRRANNAHPNYDTPPSHQTRYNVHWQDEVNAFTHSEAGRAAQQPDPDNDSAYFSSRSVQDHFCHWRAIAGDQKEHIDRLKEQLAQLGRKDDETATIRRELKDAKDSIVDYRHAEEEFRRDAEEARRNEVDIRQKLHAASVQRDKDAKEIDRLRGGYGQQLLAAGSGEAAVKELEPLVKDLHESLRSLENEYPPNVTAITRLMKDVRATEFDYGQALAMAGKQQESIDLLIKNLEWRRATDPDIRDMTTQDVARVLCTLLEKSTSADDWKYAERILRHALCEVDQMSLPSDVSGAIKNLVTRTRLLLNLKWYEQIPNDVRTLWRLKQHVARSQSESVEAHTGNLIAALNAAHEERIASEIILLTLHSGSEISDTAIKAIAALPSNEIRSMWAKTSVLPVSKRRQTGWELALELREARRFEDAVKILSQLPAVTAASAQEPSPKTVDDVHSQCLIELPDFASHKKAIELAVPLVKSDTFQPLEGRSRCRHAKTALIAIQKTAGQAGSRSSPAKVFENLATQCWAPIYLKANAARKGQSGNGGVDRETLDLLLESGRQLHSKWMRNAEERGCKDGKGSERRARDTLYDQVVEVKGWVAGQ